MDGYIGHWGREAKDQVGSPLSERYARNAPKNPQHNAFGEHLADLTRRRRAERGPDGTLQFPRGGADKQQVGYVRACDGQNESRNPHKEMKARKILVAQLLNPRTARRQAKRLFGDGVALS